MEKLLGFPYFRRRVIEFKWNQYSAYIEDSNAISMRLFEYIFHQILLIWIGEIPLINRVKSITAVRVIWTCKHVPPSCFFFPFHVVGAADTAAFANTPRTAVCLQCERPKHTRSNLAQRRSPRVVTVADGPRCEKFARAVGRRSAGNHKGSRAYQCSVLAVVFSASTIRLTRLFARIKAQYDIE